MGFLIRLLIFPILFVKRILWPMVKGVLKAPFKTLKLFFKSSLLIYGVAFVIIYLAVQSWSGSPGTGDHSPPPPPLSAAETAKMQEQVTELPEIQGTIADGNSPFTKKLWGKMDKPSQDLYSREFSYAMYYTPAGETHFFKGPKISSLAAYNRRNLTRAKPAPIAAILPSCSLLRGRRSVTMEKPVSARRTAAGVSWGRKAHPLAVWVTAKVRWVA